MRAVSLIVLLIFSALATLNPGVHAQNRQDYASDRIQPYSKNPRYWQYRGKPIILLGGSKDDNLFQIPDLKAHLDTLKSVGGNYIRNTMSSRQDGGFEVYPFKRLKSGKYDLSQWNPEYWRRFERMLELTHERDIIPQIELWDQWDQSGKDWNHSPWNPDNNVIYDADKVSLKGHGYYQNVRHNTNVRHDFYLTVPAAQNDSTVLRYQKKFVNKILEHTLKYDHVLYTVTNELFNQHPPAWSRYWADYLHRRARQEGTRVEVTEMFQVEDTQSDQHRVSLDDPETFDYVDISQNSRQVGQTHWDKLQWIRSYISDHPRPINHLKTYGGAVGWTDGPEHGIDRFWRNLIGGAASARFHRPNAGVGLNDRAQANLRSARMLAENFNFFTARPDVESRRLDGREINEAYLTYTPDNKYAVYFPDGGFVRLDLRDTAGDFRLRWLNAAESEWNSATPVKGRQMLRLVTPGDGDWVALVERE